MTAIAGIAAANVEAQVEAMLVKMGHRGQEGCLVKSIDGVTMGVCWPAGQLDAGDRLEETCRAEDVVSDSHYAWAAPDGETFTLSRDPLGVAPLYYGRNGEGQLCFASEVKGLVDAIEEIRELPPGSEMRSEQLSHHFTLTERDPLDVPRQEVAAELRKRLEAAVAERAGRGVPFGSWLSGGLDSSALAALSCRHIRSLHTFAAGFEGAPDLEAARLVARHIGAVHHEVIPTFREIVQVIPDVIRHLESFDALLVRSSLMNFLVAKLAADYVPAIFSGEGGDELFAGYSYLKNLSLEELSSELVDISNRLHNTALQRVDRCASAHGTVAYVAFLDQDVLEYAVSIPPEYKIVSGLEKWILRQAVMDLLPYQIVQRKKAKFWEGAGVEERLSVFAEAQVTDADFERERVLPDGSQLNTKEELFYYRIFADQVGHLEDLNWMGRTKGAPIQ